jgi:hypothetical protein
MAFAFLLGDMDSQSGITGATGVLFDRDEMPMFPYLDFFFSCRDSSLSAPIACKYSSEEKIELSMFGRQFLILSYCKAAVSVVLVVFPFFVAVVLAAFPFFVAVVLVAFPFLVNDTSKDNCLLRDGMVVAFSSAAKTEVAAAMVVVAAAPAVTTAFSSAAETEVVSVVAVTTAFSLAAAMVVVAAALAVMTAFSLAAAMEVVAAALAVTTAFSSAVETSAAAMEVVAAVPEVSASAAKGGDAFFVALMCLDARVAVLALDLDGGGMMMMK